MGNEIFEEIKRKYKKSNKYMLCVSYEDIGILIQIIETMNKRKLEDMTFEYFNDYEVKTIVSQYLEDLKDFGFYYNDDIGQYVYNLINEPLTINVWNRKLNISDYNCLTNKILSAIIYKLTKLGYLEYIEDKGE